MAKIEELIKKLCPNGVKYYMLGELEDEKILKLGRGNVISKDEKLGLLFLEHILNAYDLLLPPKK